MARRGIRGRRSVAVAVREYGGSVSRLVNRVTGHADNCNSVLILLEETDEVAASVVNRVSATALYRCAVLFQRRQRLGAKDTSKNAGNTGRSLSSIPWSGNKHRSHARRNTRHKPNATVRILRSGIPVKHQGGGSGAACLPYRLNKVNGHGLCGDQTPSQQKMSHRRSSSSDYNSYSRAVTVGRQS